MGTILVPGLTCSESTIVRRTRTLPVRGTISVKVGETVRSDQEVGSAALPGDLIIVRVAEKLAIEPFEAIEGLKVKLGQHVAEGEVLCEHAGMFGLFKSQCKSPCAGVVELVTEQAGHLAIRLASRPISIDAYLEGKVVEVENGMSVTIETRAAFIQGIFGVGGEREGKIKVLSVDAGQKVRIENIPADCSGLILVGGTAPDNDTIKAAADRGARGFVVGSISDQALAAYLGYDLGIAHTGDEVIPMSLIITEGFGTLPLSERIMSLVKKFDGEAAALNGATQVRAGAVRPELIIFQNQSQADAKAIQAGGLEVGASIRLIRVPYFGLLGTVTELPHDPEKIETGAITRVLRAKLNDGKIVTVPRANVELVQ